MGNAVMEKRLKRGSAVRERHPTLPCYALLHRRTLIAPRPRLLEGRGERDDAEFVGGPADYLQSDRQPGFGTPVGQRERRLSRGVERKSELDVRVKLFLEFVRRQAQLECRTRQGRRERRVVGR